MEYAWTRRHPPGSWRGRYISQSERLDPLIDGIVNREGIKHGTQIRKRRVNGYNNRPLPRPRIREVPIEEEREEEEEEEEEIQDEPTER